MAATVNDNMVTFEDQQRINRFARTSAQLMELKEELTAKMKQLEDLNFAKEELLLSEAETNTIPYQIGEILAEMSVHEAGAEVEKAKEICHLEISDLMRKADSYKHTFEELRTALFGRFGSNINLNLNDM